ncbi:MAG: hypothetical protein HY816_18145 [Candidatus Wallbacteria bacterium]|nr:hypothetical protein [Candidatus Wallbacteria bacterium]
MKPRTLEVLSRVQAVREAARRRELLAAADRANLARAERDRLDREELSVRSAFGSDSICDDLRLQDHALRYADRLRKQAADASEDLRQRETEQEAARAGFLKSLVKSGVLARKRREADSDGE